MFIFFLSKYILKVLLMTWYWKYFCTITNFEFFAQKLLLLKELWSTLVAWGPSLVIKMIFLSLIAFEYMFNQ